jgi:hypothetical protein
MVLGITCGDASTSVTYFQAWEYWASGRPDSGCLVLWGLSLRWWGRIGQLVAFTGSLLVVAELVDLPGIAESFRDVRTAFERAASAVWNVLWREGLGFVILLVGSFILYILVQVIYLVLVVSYGVGGFWEIWLRPAQHFQFLDPECTTWWRCLIGAVFAERLGPAWTIAVSVSLILVSIGFAVLFDFILGYFIPNVIIAPLIWVLRILPRWAKALNLLLIVIGFHFNLLAS